MKKLIVLLTILAYFQISYSQSGTLDPSFANKGIVRTDFGGTDNPGATGRKVLIQPGGTMYLILSSNDQTLITRILANGVTDSSYGNNGYSQSVSNGISGCIFCPSEALGALQSDGKVVVAGGYGLVRYHADGTLDTTFSKDGATAVTIQIDGKIVAAGSSGGNLTLARYNTDGTPDSTFSEDGKQTADFDLYADVLSIQSDGKIVVAGTVFGSDNAYFGIARYNTDGTLDKTFSEDGKELAKYHQFYSLAIQNDGKIVAAGTDLVRYNTDGTVDSTFSADRKQVDPGGAFVAIQSDGKIVVATIGGDYPNIYFAISRYNTDGTLDTTFSKDGKQTANFGSSSYTSSIAIQSDGKIVVAGTTYLNDRPEYAVARFNINGSFDTSFSSDGKVTNYLHVGNTTYTCTAIQDDGKIVVAGSGLARYNTDGTLDTTFSEDGKQTAGFGSQALSVAIQTDGKIVVAGGPYFARYNTDGTLDTTFAGDGMTAFDGPAQSLTIQGDGKIVVARSAILAIARYNTDGTPDSTFSEDGKTGFDGDPQSVTIQSDGKIVVAGFAGDYPDLYGVLARYNTDGTLDETFSKDGTEVTNLGAFYSSAIQNDGKIVVAGTDIVRYNTGGTLDSTFSEDRKQTTDFEWYGEVLSVAIQSDGKIVVAGSPNGSFALLRLNINGSLDSTFGKGGRQVTDASAGNDVLNDIVISDNKLYAVGSGENPGLIGIVARYFLNNKNQTPPTVNLTTPVNNTTRLAPAAHIKLTATASDADGTISKVEFYNGTHLLHTEHVIPYGFVWRNVPVGNYTLTAKAYDNDGLVTTSAAVHISVVQNKPPTVSMIKPKNNQSFAAPAYIHFEADAKDLNGRITWVEFYNGSKLLRTEYKYPYTYVWKNVPVGTYAITAVATDNWGAQTTSAPVTVRVIPRNTIVSNRPFSVDDETGINEAISLRLIPNPAKNILNIYIRGIQKNDPLSLTVISAAGVVLRTMQTNSSSKVIQVDISKLVSGAYTIKLMSGDKVLFKQFVKL